MMRIKMLMVLHASSSKRTINVHRVRRRVRLIFEGHTLGRGRSREDPADCDFDPFHSTDYGTAPTLIPDQKLDS